MTTRRFRIVLEIDCKNITRKDFNEIVRTGFTHGTSLLAVDVHPFGELVYVATEEIKDVATIKRRYP